MIRLDPQDEAFLKKFIAWKHRPKDHRPGTDRDPTPQQIYARLMKEVFAPALRTAGLKGSNGRFELPREACWAQLGFQKSAFSDTATIQFTVNLSVIDRSEWDRRVLAAPDLGKRPSPSVHYGPWAVQERIGRLMTGGEDVWWRMDRGDNPDPLADQVVLALVEVGVPWLVSRAASAS